jgi:hypothetical protein
LARRRRWVHLDATTRKDKPMIDEYMMRYWVDGHDELSHVLDRPLARLAGLANTLRRNVRSIGLPYAPGTSRPEDEAHPAARAALAGVMACFATAAMLLTLSLLFADGIPNGASTGAVIVGHAIVA